MSNNVKPDYPGGKATNAHDPDINDEGEKQLEIAVGSQIRTFRKQLRMTVGEVAKKANVSNGMLSKIERGVTAPSLSTLQSIATALNVPITSFFRKFEEQRDCTFIKSGQGLPIERRATRSGHQYQLLGHNIGDALAVEPYLITFTDESEVFPIFEHPGIEFLYLLEGEVLYRHLNTTYHMKPGDSMFFDADAPHGPAELIKLPIKMIAVLCRAFSN